MASRWIFPIDPGCPEVREYHESLWNDPMSEMVPSDVLGEIQEDWERKHNRKCKRCQEYGAANVDVE